MPSLIPRVSKDKRDHVVYSYAICLGLSVLMSCFGIFGAGIAAGITFCIGVFKELIDKFDDNSESYAEIKDIMADLTGIAFAFVTWHIGFSTLH